MKKILALILALIMCVGVFAACGEKEEPAAKDPVDTPADKPEDKPSEPTDKPAEPTDKPAEPTDKPAEPTDKPAESEKLKPGLQADGVTFVGVMDATDDFTLVIETPGTAGDERIGKKAEAGKVEVAKYNTAGSRRQDIYVLDWASLGLEGCSWEYLGSTFILDVTDKENPKLVNEPKKSASFFVFSQVTVVTENNVTTVTLPDGRSFVTSTVHYGMIRPNHLLNEGGWYIPKWNDLNGGGTTNIFTQEKFMKDYYFYTDCELYGQKMALYLPEVPADYTGPKSPRDSGLVPAE